MAKKTFQVSVRFDCVSAENELEAAKIIAGWLKDDADSFIYDVEDEKTKVKVTVALSEEEDAVLPNND